jgi:thiamine biosynthesis lipoprotein
MRFANRWAAVLLVSLFSFGQRAQSSDRQILVYKKKYIMGTVFEIAAYSGSSEQASLAIEKAFQEIVRLDDLMSNYKPESALSHLNRSAHFHTETVPPDLYSVIQQAVQFSKLSQGKFDITVAPLVNLWKAALSGDSIPSPAQQQQAQACVGYEKIALTPPDEIIFQSTCLQLDLGAIGKGYAVDRAVAILQSLGIHNAFINAGGSTIFAMGSPPGQTSWLVHLRDPSHKFGPYVRLSNESVSTSEQSAASLLGLDSAGHVVDPTTGRPLKTEFAVSVVARTATLSDGLSTTLLLLGPTQGKPLVNRTADTSAIWLSAKGQIETAISGPQILFGKL